MVVVWLQPIPILFRHAALFCIEHVWCLPFIGCHSFTASMAATWRVHV